MEREQFRVWEFRGHDEAYKQWLENHSSGFVVNTNNSHSPEYMILHRAMCVHISNFQNRKVGAFTEREFVKVCGLEVEHLREWVKQHGRSDGSFSSECGVCKPIAHSHVSATATAGFEVKGLSQAEAAKLLEQCRHLPPSQGNYLINDYVENVLLTVLDFMLQTPTVEKAAQHYLTHAKEEVRTHQDLKRLLDQYPDTQEGNTQVAQYLWGYNFWTRVELLRRFLVYLESQGVTTQEQLKSWAEKTSFQEFEGKVRGMGMGIFQWLVMRQGVETIKPDIWVHRFVKAAIGRNVSDTLAVAALEAAAQELGLKAYELDWRIWEYQREHDPG